MDSHEVASKARSRLATPELSMWINKIKVKILSDPYLTEGGGSRAVLYLRLTSSEREMLRAAAADDDGHSPPRDISWDRVQIRKVANLLFLRWSFTQHALREILYQLGEIETDDLCDSDFESDSNSDSTTSSSPAWFFSTLGWALGTPFHRNPEAAWRQPSKFKALINSIVGGLETRHDYVLPWDRRHERVTELLEDPNNEGFWKQLKSGFGDLAQALDSNNTDDIVLGPHSADCDIWWDLAIQVIKKRQTMRHWPGVNEAACHAIDMMRGWTRARWLPHLDNTAWYKKFLAASANKTAHKGRPNFYVHLRRGQHVPPIPAPDGGNNPFRLSACYPEYEEEWVGAMNAVVDAANVWDVWTLLRMIKCEAASRELEQTMGPGGHEMLQEVLMQGPRDMTNPCPVWNQCLRDFAELACYGSSMYQFHDVTDPAIVAELLGSIGLEDTGNWDLVSLDGARRVWALPEFYGNLDHYRHVLHVSDDVNKRYFEAGRGFPGQTVPCRCKEQAPGDEVFDWGGFEVQGRIGSFTHNKHCQGFHGGEVVFARRKLEDSALVQNLDRFWVDWNDCLFIQGRGLDGHGCLIDGDTMYILETLPGIKARELKSRTPDPARGQVSACLYFNLKLENRESDALSRSMLQEIMGPEYHPRYSDYTYLIDSHEMDFTSATNVSRPQPGLVSASVLWEKARRYGEDGNVTSKKGMALVKIMAESEDEHALRRYFTNCYDFVAGNRIKNLAHFYGFTTAPVWFGHRATDLGLTPSLWRQRNAEDGVTRQKAWALVFEDSECDDSLIDALSDCSLTMTERGMWLTNLTFLYEIGTAVREIHKVVGRPYCLINTRTIRLRRRPSPPLCARAASTPAGHFEPLLSPPADPPPRLSPELRWGGDDEPGLHTPSTDAYSFARYALDLIAGTMGGLRTGLSGLAAPGGGSVKVFYVEVLVGLETVLRGDVAPDAWEGLGGLGKVGLGSEGGGEEEAVDRAQAMYCFLKLLKKVAEGSLVLDGVFPVHESSGWYDLETAFPRVCSLLNGRSEGWTTPDWFNRRSVLLFWMMRPAGWSWGEDELSSGSEWDGLAGGGGGESVWDGSNRGGPKSDTTVE